MARTIAAGADDPAFFEQRLRLVLEMLGQTAAEIREVLDYIGNRDGDDDAPEQPPH